MKLFWLNLRRIGNCTLKWIGYNISIILLLFSVTFSFLLIFPICFHRVPIYSYFISELKLPYSYSLEGDVQLFDINGNVVNQNIDVYIGGYKTTAAADGTFFLKFSASNANEVPIVFSYATSNGNHVTQVEYITLANGVYVLQKGYVFYV